MSAVAYLPPGPTTLAVLGAQVLARYARRTRAQLALPLWADPTPAAPTATEGDPPALGATITAPSVSRPCWSCGTLTARPVTCGARACRLARRRHVNAPSHARQNARRRAERAAAPVVRRRTPTAQDRADAIERRYQQARAWRRYCQAVGRQPSALDPWQCRDRAAGRIVEVTA